MTESCYPSVPLSLQFNYSMPLYGLSFQNYQKRENNQGVHFSFKNPTQPQQFTSPPELMFCAYQSKKCYLHCPIKVS